MNRTPAAPTTGRLARQILSVCLWAAAVVFLARTARGVGWGVLGDRLADAAPLLVGLTFLVTLLRYAAWGTRWQILLRPIERVPWWAAQRALMASLFVTTVVPASRPFGGLVRARHLGRAIRRPAGPLYGGTVVDQFGYGIVSTSLGAVSLPFALWAGRAGGAGDLLLWVAGGAAIIAALALAWRRKGSIVDRLRRRAPKMAGALEGAAGSARDLAARPSTWGVMAAGGALVWWANVLTFQIAAAALGSSLSLPAAAAAFALGSLAGTLSGTPGGAGTTELAAMAPLVALGVPTDGALAAVLLARGVHYASCLLIGGAALLAARRP